MLFQKVAAARDKFLNVTIQTTIGPVRIYTHINTCTHALQNALLAERSDCAWINQILSLNPVLIDWYDPKKVSARVYKMSCPLGIPCTIILLKHSIHMRNATFLP